MRHLALGLLAAILISAAAPSGAVVLSQDYPGQNDCSGTFNPPRTGFEACKDPRGSPIIAKFDTGVNGGWTLNSLFGDVQETDFTLNFAGEGLTGSWSYDRCTTCPYITSFVVKSGGGFRWYYTLPLASLTGGTWETLLKENGGGGGLSHISFYDTLLNPDPQIVVPLPLPAFLLLGALGTLGALKRRRKTLA